ncbi:unnamed protein product [Effrenium voratum]|uniref:Uncharacterized protein n=1 Tax=Effrenium voratum TaxID=2562239 RepID=A0AA36ML17_9DINO|nr:unnamed protein product [Effrenium voratum]
MVQEGPINVSFNAQSYGVDVGFDPQTQEQFLSFRFAVTVSLPQLLQQLIEIQKQDGAAVAPISQSRMPFSRAAAAPVEATATPFKPSVAIAPKSQGPEGLTRTRGQFAMDIQLLECVQRHETAQVKELLKQRADVNFQEGTPYLRTPLHLAVENGGTVDEIGHLLQAAANVNAVMAQGKTPLHVAVQQYRKIPTVAIGMLLCSKAKPDTKDSSGRTPMDLVKQVFAQLSARGPDNQPLLSVADSGKARQLLSLVMDQRMVAFNLESQEVQGVHFADTEGDKLVYDTKSGVGLYSIKAQRTLFFKNLKQKNEGSVYNVAVNPEAGTVAACLRFQQDTPEATQSTIVMVIWPNGQLQHEEPLKLRLPPTAVVDRDLLPPMVTMSRTLGTSIVIGRLADGQVYCWQLNSARSQLVSEVKLASCAGVLASSDDGSWVALANKETGHFDVYMLDLAAHRQARLAYQPVNKLLNKRPAQMSVQSLQDACLVAFVEDLPGVQSQPVIEVTRAGCDGSLQTVYRVPIPSACSFLSFCYKSSASILCSCAEGLQLVFNLSNSETSCAYDNVGVRSVSISKDQTLLASAEKNFFKVYKVPAPSASS